MADQKYTIVTTMKNEGPFILEWIAYHRAIGFNGFTVYTNDCDDGTDEIIMRLEELGVATHVVNTLRRPGISPQRNALRNTQWHDKTQEADWLMCADVDEFLVIRTGNGHLSDLMEAVGDVDAISFCWKLFGNGQQQEFKPGFVTEQFLWAAPENKFPNQRSSGLKTIMCNNEKFTRIKIHRPLIAEDPKDLKWVDAGGQNMPPRYLRGGWSAHHKFSHKFARLHHYAVRSIDSFLVKRDRGRTNHTEDDQGIDYWQAMNANYEYDDSILSHLLTAKAEFGRLIADPVLAGLYAKACEWHIAKIQELKEREGWPEFRAQIASIDNGAAWLEKQKNG
ncbi:glycosyltransferase family 2 protein [Yoonia sp. GPGPB17]|uniref:glycosyltransferase family 2 protein n=1 Tax=Yoonia sp. GPGPB17 TaxID=3026147 RepID=UPI0030C5AF89